MSIKQFVIWFTFLTLTTLLLANALGQVYGHKCLAERLGYSSSDRLLIVHADDLGLAHSVNVATFRAIAAGQISSASIMMTCPWVQEVADYARKHPSVDFGVHLTLTSEWHPYRWGPVASRDDVASLISPLGYFYTIRDGLARFDPREAEIELKAQIALAKEIGIEPTHLDSHQLALFLRPKLFETYLKVGREMGLPVLLAAGLFSMIRERMGDSAPDFEALLGSGDIVINEVLSIAPEDAPYGWATFYQKALDDLQPGVSQLIVHLGFDDEEMRGMAGELPFGGAWRQNEFDYLTSPRFGESLRENGIKLITWRDIANLRNKE